VADSCRLSVVSGVVRSRVTGDRLPVLRHELEAAALGGRSPSGGGRQSRQETEDAHIFALSSLREETLATLVLGSVCLWLIE
jgi:hypothetical protein